MTDDHTDDPMHNKVQILLAHAVAGLHPTDLAERVDYCREHNQHGIRLHPSPDDDLLEFRWGGKTLCMIRRDVLFGDGPIMDVEQLMTRKRLREENTNG